ncbi:MAG: Mbov_0396 family ICE element transmembrane protein [Metamycoplasmataceae bacterium]
MYINWLLEFVWRIFIQGPLMIINSFSEVLKRIFGLKFFDFAINTNGNSILQTVLSYSLSAAFVSAFLLVVFLFQFIVVFLSEKGIIKNRIINSFKRLGLSFFLIILVPIAMMLFALVFDQISIVFNNIWFNSTGDAGSSMAKLLYDIGYWDAGSVPNPGGTTGSFGPPAYEHLIKYNFALQIFVVNFTMILVLYFSWNFLQKIIEMFMLYITYPFGVLASVGSDQITSKIWFKEILNKATIAMLTILLYHLFVIFVFSQAKDLIGSGAATPITSKILFTVLLTAFGFAAIYLNAFVSRLFYQYSGFINSYKSAKQTFSFSNKYINVEERNSYKSYKKETVKEIEVRNEDNQFLKSMSNKDHNQGSSSNSSVNKARIFK